MVLLGGNPCLEGSQHRGDVKMEGSCFYSQSYLLRNMRLRGGPWSAGGRGALAGERSRSRGVEVTHPGPGPCRGTRTGSTVFSDGALRGCGDSGSSLGHQGQEEAGVGLPKGHPRGTYLETQETLWTEWRSEPGEKGSGPCMSEVRVQRGRGFPEEGPGSPLEVSESNPRPGGD